MCAFLNGLIYVNGSTHLTDFFLTIYILNENYNFLTNDLCPFLMDTRRIPTFMN